MKQTLQLRTSQHLALTPQLQQSIRLLQLSKNGCVVSDIRARLSIKQSNLYRQFDVIKDKLNVHKIGEAVRKADLSGLLG